MTVGTQQVKGGPSWFASISPVGPAPTMRTSVSLCRCAPFSGLCRALELLEESLDGGPLRADIVVSRLGEARRVVRMKQEKAEELRSGVPLAAQSAHDPPHTRRQEPALPRGEIGQIARRVQQQQLDRSQPVGSRGLRR